MLTINALKIRASLGSILDNVSQKGEHYIVERMGKPLAVIIPYHKFDIEKEESQQRQKQAQEAIDSINYWRKKNIQKYKTIDSATLVRRMRDQRGKHLLEVVEGRQ